MTSLPASTFGSPETTTLSLNPEASLSPHMELKRPQFSLLPTLNMWSHRSSQQTNTAVFLPPLKMAGSFPLPNPLEQQQQQLQYPASVHTTTTQQQHVITTPREPLYLPSYAATPVAASGGATYYHQLQQQQHPMPPTTTTTTTTTLHHHHHHQPSTSPQPSHTTTTTSSTQIQKILGPTTANSRATKQQVKILMQLFNQNATPSGAQHDAIAQRLGMTKKAVRNWFQNQRAKMRRVSQEAAYRREVTAQYVVDSFGAGGGGGDGVVVDGLSSGALALSVRIPYAGQQGDQNAEALLTPVTPMAATPMTVTPMTPPQVRRNVMSLENLI
ncbi:homeobox domain-containing protein [Chytriomyces cf. hyalinus JEL632]|nr:homeobox domain-containing protein [Chytriomyces cf. hyalinus JEL632]